MPDQLTQCPHCQTSFRVTQTQLAAAKGMVRCGSCLGLFSASINFIRVKSPLKTDTDESSDDISIQSPAALADDEVALGDLNLDDLTDTEDNFIDEEDFEEEAVLDEDMVSAMEEAEEILLQPATRPQPIETRQFLTYEEYQDVPDLFDQLEPDTTDSNDDEVNQQSLAALETEEPELDSDLFDDDSAESDDEFHPSGYIEDEAAGDDEDDFDELSKVSLADELVDESDSDIEYSVARALDEIDLDSALSDDELTLDDLELEDSDGPGFDENSVDAAAIINEFYDDLDSDEFDNNEFGHNDFNSDDDLDLSETDSHSSTRSKPEWFTTATTHHADKAQLHDYLAELEDEDELEPLGSAHLEMLEAEPVMMTSNSSSRGLLATAGLMLLSLALLAVLVLQFVDHNLEQLTKRNSFTAFKPVFCRILDCPVAVENTALSSLYSQELLIRTHPRTSNALELSFIFRNDADSTQRFPGLELSFKDIDNSLLANRLFLPAEYLPAELQKLDLMPAHSSLQVLLELVDPGEKAVNYTIAFRDL